MPPPRPERELPPQRRAEFPSTPVANLWSQAVVGARERSFLPHGCAPPPHSLYCLQLSCLTSCPLSAVDGSRTVPGGKLRGLHHQQEHRNVLGSPTVQVPSRALHHASLYLPVLQVQLNRAAGISIMLKKCHFKAASSLSGARRFQILPNEASS